MPKYFDPDCPAPIVMHSSANLGTKGQVVIPKGVRDMLSIHSGDSLTVVTKDGAVGLIKNNDLPVLLEYLQSQVDKTNISPISIHSSVVVGTKGQVVIPKGVRDMLSIHSGDSLTVVTKDGAVGLIKNNDLPALLEYLAHQIHQ